MRAMPSPTSSTRPTSRASSLARYWSISADNTETISSALNLITASRNDLVANTFQFRPHGQIVEPVADAHDHAAQQIGIDLGLEYRLLVKGRPQLLAQAFPLVIAQSHGAPNLHRHPACFL